MFLTGNSLPSSFTGNEGITGNNFAAALGLPEELHHEKPQAVYRHWRLREDQFLFLREKVCELRDASWAVRLWDEQHRWDLFLDVGKSLSFR